MPRLSSAKSTQIAQYYSMWISDELKRTNVTPGQLAYLTRPHSRDADDDSPEISHSNLTKLILGQSAPALSTALRIPHLISKISRRSSSTLESLWHSYPHVIAQIVLGLDLQGIARHSPLRRKLSQQSRRRMRSRLQNRLGAAGNAALESSEGYRKRHKAWRAFPAPSIERWVKTLLPHPDLLGIAIAYAYFSSFHGDTESTEMMSVFGRYDAQREEIYRSALDRYNKDFATQAQHSDHLTHDALATAMNIIKRATGDYWGVTTVSPI